MGNTVKTTVLLAALSGVLLLIGDLMGGRSGLIIALGFAVVMNIGSYWFSDKIVLAMYKAQPVGPNHPLHQIVQRLSQRAGLPMPKV
jgi:heat shock protein HtpX